jgi:hypothetical protein
MLLRMGWKGQHTDEPKPVDSPDNLFETLSGDPGAHGRFDDRSRRTTLCTTLRLRRSLVPAAALLAASVTAVAPRVRKRLSGTS